jgi:Sigma-70, region 4
MRMREPLPAEEIEAVPAASDPVAEAIRRADLAALWSAIQALPRQQREALVLRELGGLSYDELADALTVSGAAVESLLFRARRRLRKTLRAAAASLPGLPWLETLAGGSAPVAAKVAVLGVGAAAVTGGIVGPAALDDRHPPRPPEHVRTQPATVVRDAPLHVVSPTHTVVVPARHEAGSESRGRDGREASHAVVAENERSGSSHDGSVSVTSSAGSGSSGREGGGSGERGSDAERSHVTVAQATLAPVTTVSSGDGERSSAGGESGDDGHEGSD